MFLSPLGLLILLLACTGLLRRRRTRRCPFGGPSETLPCGPLRQVEGRPVLLEEGINETVPSRRCRLELPDETGDPFVAGRECLSELETGHLRDPNELRLVVVVCEVFPRQHCKS